MLFTHLSPQPWELLSRARLVLWDFDGPVCDLFAHHSAVGIAAALTDSVGPIACREAGLAGVTDPLEVLRKMDATYPGDPDGRVSAVRKRLEEAEVKAAESATPTPGAVDLMEQLCEGEKQLAVASNNSEASIRAYLHRHDIARHFGGRIVGRPDEPGLMKPDPYALLRLLKETGKDAGESVMIGDSPPDATAAAEAGVLFIGFHPDRDKRERLRAAGAVHFAANMADLLSGGPRIAASTGTHVNFQSL